MPESGWQPPQYDPRQHQQRTGGQQPPQPPPPGYGPSHPQYDPMYANLSGAQQPVVRARPRRRRRSRGPLYAVAVVALVVIAGIGAAYALSGGTSTGSPAASTGTAEPETAAGVRAAAQQFYALYSASQWDAAWAYLAPSVQAKVSRATWTAVHSGCTAPGAGMARVIKSVTVTGSTAVITETVAGSLGNLGTGADAWTYGGGRWGFLLTGISVYGHGSATADIAAAKAAGDCAS